MCTYCKVLQYIAIMTSSMLKSSFATIHTRTFSYFLPCFLQRWKPRQLEAAPADLGHGLMNVAAGQKTTEAILAQNTILTSPLGVECPIFQAHQWRRANVCAASYVSLLFSGEAKGGFFFSPPRFCLFVFYWLASQANLSAQPLTD